MTSMPPDARYSGGDIKPPSLPQKRGSARRFDWAEKRHAKRIDVSTELSFQSESNFYMGFTADISSGGVFVVTWDILPIGSHIALSFTLPNTKKEIKIDGVVRWVREHNPTEPDLWPGMGIQFDGIAESDAAMVQNFIENREPLFYD